MMASGLFGLFLLPSCSKISEVPLHFVEVLQIRQGPSKGSGTLVASPYCASLFLITNQHVVPRSTSVEASWRGKYLKLRSKPINAGGEFPRDLAFIRLERSEVEHLGLLKPDVNQPRLHSSLKPLLGDSKHLLSIGYPINHSNLPVTRPALAPSESIVSRSSKSMNIPATHVKGAILKKLFIPLRGGYDLVISHDLQQGMSGGALLDHSGGLIGINALHALPAWDAPLQDETGITVQSRDQQFIESSAMAISVGLVAESVRPVLRRLCGPSQGSSRSVVHS